MGVFVRLSSSWEEASYFPNRARAAQRAAGASPCPGDGSVLPYGLFNGDQDVVVVVRGRFEVRRLSLEAKLQDRAGKLRDDLQGDREAVPFGRDRKVRRVLRHVVGRIATDYRLDERVGRAATTDVAAFGVEAERDSLADIFRCDRLFLEDVDLDHVGGVVVTYVGGAAVVVIIHVELLGRLSRTALIVN